MSNQPIEAHPITAAEARDHVSELEAERALADLTGVAEIDSYIDDLEAELESWRRLYVLSAVTEIATLRAELHGRLSDDGEGSWPR